jgi:hypothetical protein
MADIDDSINISTEDDAKSDVEVPSEDEDNEEASDEESEEESEEEAREYLDPGYEDKEIPESSLYEQYKQARRLVFLHIEGEFDPKKKNPLPPKKGEKKKREIEEKKRISDCTIFSSLVNELDILLKKEYGMNDDYANRQTKNIIYVSTKSLVLKYDYESETYDMDQIFKTFRKKVSAKKYKTNSKVYDNLYNRDRETPTTKKDGSSGMTYKGDKTRKCLYSKKILEKNFNHIMMALIDIFPLDVYQLIVWSGNKQRLVEFWHHILYMKMLATTILNDVNTVVGNASDKETIADKCSCKCSCKNRSKDKCKCKCRDTRIHDSEVRMCYIIPFGSYEYRGLYLPFIKIGLTASKDTDRFKDHNKNISYPSITITKTYTTTHPSSLENYMKKILECTKIKYNGKTEVFSAVSFNNLFNLHNSVHEYVYWEYDPATIRILEHKLEESNRIQDIKIKKLESDKEQLKDDTNNLAKIMYQQLSAAVEIIRTCKITPDQQETLDENQQVLDYVKTTYPTVEEESEEESEEV